MLSVEVSMEAGAVAVAVEVEVGTMHPAGKILLCSQCLGTVLSCAGTAC